MKHLSVDERMTFVYDQFTETAEIFGTRLGKLFGQRAYNRAFGWSRQWNAKSTDYRVTYKEITEMDKCRFLRFIRNREYKVRGCKSFKPHLVGATVIEIMDVVSALMNENGV